MAASVMTVNDVLDGHVGLDIECLDRTHLNGYVPNLQVSGQVVTFLARHLGNPVPSRAIFDHKGQLFRRAVTSFAEANDIAVVRFSKDDRKIDVMSRYLQAAARAGGPRVAAIVQARGTRASTNTEDRLWQCGSLDVVGRLLTDCSRTTYDHASRTDATENSRRVRDSPESA
jgi:hypothetical protein